MNDFADSNIPNECDRIHHVDSFRLRYTEDEIILDFGCIAEEEKIIYLMQSVSFSPDKIHELIVTIFNGAIEYEKEHNKDIGFTSILESKEE